MADLHFVDNIPIVVSESMLDVFGSSKRGDIGLIGSTGEMIVAFTLTPDEARLLLEEIGEAIAVAEGRTPEDAASNRRIPVQMTVGFLLLTPADIAEEE